MRQTTKVRPGLYVSDMFCDVCDKSIIGPVKFIKDVMVCFECAENLEDGKAQEVRRMPSVPWKGLAGVLAVSGATLLYVTSWPLMDALAWVGLLSSAAGLALKCYGRGYR